MAEEIQSGVDNSGNEKQEWRRTGLRRAPFAVKTKRLIISILENIPLQVFNNVNRKAHIHGIDTRQEGPEWWETDGQNISMNPDPEDDFKKFLQTRLPREKAPDSLRERIKNAITGSQN